ncbi:MAG: lysozyme [Yersinia sp. (in: enterobacteria)]
MTIKVKAGAMGGICSVTAVLSIVIAFGNVRTSPQGLALIGDAESCRRDPYVCPAGILSDGIGNSHRVIAGSRKTDAQIAADWEKNILEAERCVIRHANGNNLTQGAFDAATSIAFNAGCPSMHNSTMFQYFRAGNMVAACEQFPRWVYASTKKLKGLVVRRDKERSLCLGK